MFKQGIWQHESGLIIVVRRDAVYASTNMPLVVKTQDIFDISKWKKLKAKEVKTDD